ncbi:hypothetical protein [Mesorhizobium sp. ES1-4]|uniref:hypothetical protein n=1 Tax=Mesorhizobium sp. ES1-4 TaxID=2876627 RepID=UPI001CCCD82E|nr:hypothetical protein [Mesorhizobium sp. ES1-4]MBZ9798482.1 hypothetical protein [Mesorhizobium sp. ES1-4]
MRLLVILGEPKILFDETLCHSVRAPFALHQSHLRPAALKIGTSKPSWRFEHGKGRLAAKTAVVT